VPFWYFDVSMWHIEEILKKEEKEQIINS